VTITGTISKQERPNGQGSYYQLTTEAGVSVAVSMAESVNDANDAKVLEPFVGKKVAVDGILRGARIGQLLAYTVKEKT
jgi:hypothetical protein